MSIAAIFAVEPRVLSGSIVRIEADVSRGLHSFSIVGLAGKAVEEAKDRVSSAIKYSGFDSPKSQNHKITISLSPADIKKEGPLYDLPIALSYLIATDLIKELPTDTIFVGELGLDGSLRSVRGVLGMVQAAKENGFKSAIVPKENAQEAALIDGITILPADSLSSVINHFENIVNDKQILEPQPLTEILETWGEGRVLFEDIKGQESAKRALIIAAAGRHNVLLVGPPGTGKTMLARAFQSLLPPLNREEILAVTAIHSLCDANFEITTVPPFRAPHHTASHTALVGGGSNPRPGEVTLAHKGVLFMDEFAEFDRRSLDALRQPLEDRVVSIARVQGTAVFPADFVLIGALNPYRGQEDGTENLHRAMQETYRGKISGPILDRIDLWIEVPHIPHEILSTLERTEGETSEARKIISNAREKQGYRLRNRGVTCNAEMSSRDIDFCIKLKPEVATLLTMSATKLNLSPRSYHRLIKVARTVADLDNSQEIETRHILEALQYRIPV